MAIVDFSGIVVIYTHVRREKERVIFPRFSLCFLSQMNLGLRRIYSSILMSSNHESLSFSLSLSLSLSLSRIIGNSAGKAKPMCRHRGYKNQQLTNSALSYRGMPKIIGALLP